MPGPPGLPLLGNLLQLEAPRLHRILGAWADRYGSQYRMRLRNRGVPAGFSRAFAPLMVPAMWRATTRDLARLKEILEAGSAP